ncbi:MAG TPA: DUF2267 domain-containing protein [Myxococcaceae bacterium]|nr:DUF2267 domain-containing protein [Myxococcaceae bacterium]
MPDTGYSLFDKTVQKTNRILKYIEQAYGWPRERRNQSYAALRAVLHAVRDRLVVQESAHLAAQLPMLVRGVYFHSWDPSKVPVKMHREEFLQRIALEFPFDAPGGMERLVETVVQALKLYSTEGEWEIIKANLPKDLAPLIPTGPEQASQPVP